MKTSVVRRFYRTVARVVGVALVIAIGILAADEFWVNIPGLSGCETELCCETCENIPVDRVVDGNVLVHKQILPVFHIWSAQ